MRQSLQVSGRGREEDEEAVSDEETSDDDASDTNASDEDE